MMEPKGHVLCKQEFTFTELWPDVRYSLHNGKIDLEKSYKEALAGKVVSVVDVSVDGDDYLVYAENSETGPFLWQVDKRDTVEGSFMPVIKKYGVIMPAGLSPVEEFEYMANLKTNGKL